MTASGVGLAIWFTIAAAILVIVIRALIFVLRGYRSDAALKLGLLIAGVVNFELLFRAASAFGPDVSLLLAFFVLLPGSFLYARIANRSNPDGINVFALGSVMMLILAIVHGTSTANALASSGGLIETLDDPVVRHFQDAAIVGGISALLGIAALISIWRRRFGTRGQIVAIVSIVLPSCWTFIVWTLPFNNCTSIAPGLVLARQAGDPLSHPYSFERWPDDYTMKLIVDQAGRSRDMDTGNELRDDFELYAHLQDGATRMEQAHYDKEAGTGPLVPDDPLVLFADARAPFESVERVLAYCNAPDVQIWQVDLITLKEGTECLCSRTVYLDDKSRPDFVQNSRTLTTRSAPKTPRGFVYRIDGREFADLEELGDHLESAAEENLDEQGYDAVLLVWELSPNALWSDAVEVIRRVSSRTEDLGFLTSDL